MKQALACAKRVITATNLRHDDGEGRVWRGQEPAQNDKIGLVLLVVCVCALESVFQRLYVLLRLITSVCEL